MADAMTGWDRVGPAAEPMVATGGPFGVYRRCTACEAPIIAPDFPDDWSLDLIKEGPPEGPVDTFYTPHRPGCPAPYVDPDPGIAVRIAGNYVRHVSVSPPPVAG